jgi:hypothetical protein
LQSRQKLTRSGQETDAGQLHGYPLRRAAARAYPAHGPNKVMGELDRLKL